MIVSVGFKIHFFFKAPLTNNQKATKGWEGGSYLAQGFI